MTKLDLQKELLEKVKPGMKPSDLKKQSQKQVKKPVLSSPMSLSRSDEGYESDKSKPSIPTAPPLPNSLPAQIQALQKQLQLYKDFREADLKVKEKLKQENQSLKQTMANLQKAKPTEEPQPNEPKETKTFLCSDCQQTKPQQELSRVFGDFSFCLICSKQARLQAQQEKEPTPQPQPLLFTCPACEQEKHEVPTYKKIDLPYNPLLIKGQAYPICSTCLPHIKEYNEHEDYQFSVGED